MPVRMTSSEPGIAAWRSSAALSGARTSWSPYTSSVGTLIWGQRVAQVRRGRPRHGPETSRMESQHARTERVDVLRRHRRGEHRRQERPDEPIGRQIGQYQRFPQPLVSDAGGQRAAPSGVGRGQYQRPRDGGVPAAELQRQRAAERQPGHVRPAQAEPADEIRPGSRRSRPCQTVPADPMIGRPRARPRPPP